MEYDTIDQTPDSDEKRYSVNIFFTNESESKIRIQNLRFQTNGVLINDLQIAFTNEWISPTDTRQFDWVIDFTRYQQMSNSLELSVEVESGDKYVVKMDLSGVNKGVAFHGKMD